MSLAYPLLIVTEIILLASASGKIRYALVVILAMHVLCWLLAGKGTLRTLGFYVTLALSWLILGGYALDAPFAIRCLATIAVFAAGLFSWGSGLVRPGLRTPKVAGKPNRWRWLRYTLPIGILGTVGFLLMADPIPRTSKAVMEWGSGLRDAVYPWLAAITGAGDSYGDDADSPYGEGGEGQDTDFGERRALPASANLRTGNDLHVFLKFAEKTDFEQVIHSRPYIRQLVLNGYDRGEWSHIPTGERLIEDAADGKVDGLVQVRPARGKGIDYEIFVAASTGRALPFLADVTEAGFPAMVQMLDGWYQAGIPGDVTYQATSEPLTFENIANRELRSGITSPEYSEISDRDLKRRLRGILAQAGNADMPLSEKLIAIKRFMALNYEYSTVIENIGAFPPIENFLFYEKKGYCDFFATAGALLCRTMGVPARTAYGFAGGQAHLDEQIIAFHGNHAHSWTEIYLDGYGWVIYDVTPAGTDATAAVPPKANGPAPNPQQFADARSNSQSFDDNKNPFLAFLENIPPKVIYTAIGVALGILFLLHLYDRLKNKGGENDKKRRLRHRDRRTRQEITYDPYPDYFIDLRKLSRLMGCTDDPGDTLRELTKKIAAKGARLPAEFTDMTHYHYQVRYEGIRSDKSKEKSFRRIIREFWKSVKQ
jgi:transglutaminase-like putative cysteine protease